MNKPPAWVPKLASALSRGEDAYREAAEIILAALAADPNLTQAQVATYIGHKPPWVSSLLRWYRSGCSPGGVFGPEIAARRDKISTSKFDVFEDWPAFDHAPTSEGEATSRVFEARALCGVFTKKFIRTVNALSRDGVLPYANQWMTNDKRRDILKKLAAELSQTISAGGTALNEVNKAINEIQGFLDANEAA